MDTIREKKKYKNGFNLQFVQSSKFKTITVAAKIKGALSKETVTMRALLPYILKQGTKSYPNRTALQLKLDDLYGAVLSADGSKKGDNHIITLRLEFANGKFLPGQASVADEAMQLFSEFLLHPYIEDGAFSQTVFEREKDTLKQRINSIKDDKMSYANMRLIDEMCKGENYETHVNGYLEDLGQLTNAELFAYYQSIIKNDEIDIYILGDYQLDRMEKIVSDALIRETGNREGTPSVRDQQRDNGDPKEVIETQNVQQAKLHIGFRTNIRFADPDYFALQVFNGLFGAFPSSKLFINVREKNSLAYYASSRLESHKGLLIVSSGIAAEDYEQARDIIREQLALMKDGDFTEEELEETKTLLISQMKETLDHPQGVIEMLYQQVIGETTLTPEQLMEGIRNVSKADVIACAGKIEEDTVYLLASERGTGDE